jgi:hypothetical protein
MGNKGKEDIFRHITNTINPLINPPKKVSPMPFILSNDNVIFCENASKIYAPMKPKRMAINRLK